MMSRVMKTKLTLSIEDGGEVTIPVSILYLFFPEQAATPDEPGNGPTAQVVTIELPVEKPLRDPRLWFETLFDANEDLEAALIAHAICGDESARDDAAETANAGAGPVGEAVAWRCFHCDDVFASEHSARLHFGREEGATPACQIKGSEIGLVEALRRAENEASDAWMAIHNETTDAARAYHAQAARHRQQLTTIEQVGYDRGLADAKAHPETLGLYARPVEEPGEVERKLRERLEKRAKELEGLIRDAIGLVPLAHQNWHAAAHTDLTGDAQEAGR